LQSAPDQAFVSHSIRVVVAALTRPEAPGSLPEPLTKVQIAASLVECLLHALMGELLAIVYLEPVGADRCVVRPPVAADSLTITNSAQLAQRLQKLIEIGRGMPSTCLLGSRVQRLVCNCFAVLTEGSLRDHKFWEVIKQQAQLDRLLVSLLLDETRQPIRREIIEHIAVACSPSKLVRKPTKSVDGEMQDSSETMASENPVRVDMLATIWDTFVKIMPQTLEHAARSQEFFDIAHLVFQSVAEQSPKDLIYGEYLKQWSSVMLGHKTQEVSESPVMYPLSSLTLGKFVGREPVDHLILGFCRLLRSCLDLADSSNTGVDSL
jgi:ubiquitin carboxyl-terminal hydrolase 34